MKTYEQEKKEKHDKNLFNLTHVFEAIHSEVEKLDLHIYITDINKHGEKTEHTIEITHPTLKDFRVSILGRQWNDSDRASLWMNSDRAIYKVVGEYSDGSPRSDTQRYNFTSYLQYGEEEKLGLIKQDYRYSIGSLHTAFKATKNPKLIVKDVIPNIIKYLEIVKVVTPRIDEKVASENHVLEVQQKIAMQLGENVPQSIGKHTFTCSLGRFEISEYGSVTWTREITLEKLESLMGTGEIVKE